MPILITKRHKTHILLINSHDLMAARMLGYAPTDEQVSILAVKAPEDVRVVIAAINRLSNSLQHYTETGRGTEPCTEKCTCWWEAQEGSCYYCHGGGRPQGFPCHVCGEPGTHHPFSRGKLRYWQRTRQNIACPLHGNSKG